MRTTRCICLCILLTVTLAPSAQTGVTSCAGLPDGTACDNGNPCTSGPRCQSEVCVLPATFVQPAGSPIGVADYPKSAKAADVNRDGNPDLVVLNYTSQKITILLGDGTGTFAPASGSVNTVSREQSLTLADFNLDGKLDIAVSHAFPGEVTVYLGNGVGGFDLSPHPPVFVGNDMVAIAAGDFNLDGKPDVVTTDLNIGTMYVLLGDGAGGLSVGPGSPFAAGSGPGIVVGDFNRDGKPDVAVADQHTDSARILLGNGNGTFSFGSSVSTATAFNLDIGDLNLDGNPDLIVAGQLAVTILMGDGSGAFSPGFVLHAPTVNGGQGDFIGASVGDFNADGLPDVAVLNYWLYEFSILLGDGAGGFVELRDPSFGPVSSPSSAPVADFNRDGRDDLAVTNFLIATVPIFLNHVSGPPDGTACSDGNPCTTGDTCSGGSCVGGPGPDCNDNNPCTDDACDPATGCVSTNNTAPCDDGNPCTTGDTCGGGSCVGGPGPDCNDNNPCTDDACNPATGCMSTNNSAPCDDGDPATGNDVCSGGTCSGTVSCEVQPKPRSYGYYKKLCKDGHSHPDTHEDVLTNADAVCVGGLTATFAGIATVEDLCAVLEQAQGSGDGYDSRECHKGEQELMATALNVCRQRVCLSQEVDSSCSAPIHVLTTVQASLDDADGILSDTGRAKDVCKEARCLTKEINNGHGLHHTSLLLAKGNGNTVRLSWGSPIMQDGSGEASSYTIWRRPLHSGAAFARLGTTTAMTFIDNAPAIEAFEYEVTFTLEP